jgi:hypothetical protein
MNTGVLSVNASLSVTGLYLILDLGFVGFSFLRIEKEGAGGLVLVSLSSSSYF